MAHNIISYFIFLQKPHLPLNKGINKESRRYGEIVRTFFLNATTPSKINSHLQVFIIKNLALLFSFGKRMLIENVIGGNKGDLPCTIHIIVHKE